MNTDKWSWRKPAMFARSRAPCSKACSGKFCRRVSLKNLRKLPSSFPVCWIVFPLASFVVNVCSLFISRSTASKNDIGTRPSYLACCISERGRERMLFTLLSRPRRFMATLRWGSDSYASVTYSPTESLPGYVM